MRPIGLPEKTCGHGTLVGLNLVRESSVDPAAQAGACTVSAGVGGAAGGGDVQEEKGEEEAEEGLRVDFDEVGLDLVRESGGPSMCLHC